MVRSSVAVRSASDRVTTISSPSARTSSVEAPTPVRLLTGCDRARTADSAVAIPSGCEIRTRSSPGAASCRLMVPTVSRSSRSASRTDGHSASIRAT